MKKLTIVTLNGNPMLAYLPVDPDGKVRIDVCKAMRAIGLDPTRNCFWLR